MALGGRPPLCSLMPCGAQQLASGAGRCHLIISGFFGVQGKITNKKTSTMLNVHTDGVKDRSDQRSESHLAEL